MARYRKDANRSKFRMEKIKRKRSRKNKANITKSKREKKLSLYEKYYLPYAKFPF